MANRIYNTAYSSAISVQRYLLPHSVNPLTPWSDQHLISPYNITPDHQVQKLLLVTQILLTSTSELYTEQQGEYAY